MARRALNSSSRPRRFLRVDLLQTNWVAAKMILILYKRCLITVSEFADSKMSLALFTICLISQMHGSEAVGGQCKTSERSVPGKALKGHTFKEFAARAIVECQNTCENDPRCASYNFYIPDKVCELNSQTKETRPDDFVTDELRFYMRREGTMYSVFLRCLRLSFLHCAANASGIIWSLTAQNGTDH